jgi:Na+-transporting methylmalonyl-CoA/oxaloacetate decarboxylase gamma subunit
MAAVGSVRLGVEMMGLGMALVFAALIIITALIVLAEKISAFSIGRSSGKAGGTGGAGGRKENAAAGETDARTAEGLPASPLYAAVITAATRRYVEDTASRR